MTLCQVSPLDAKPLTPPGAQRELRPLLTPIWASLLYHHHYHGNLSHKKSAFANSFGSSSPLTFILLQS